MEATHKASLALGLALIALGVVLFGSPKGAEEKASTRETAYARVVRTQTLRCGYIPFVPNLVKDLNTGAISGLDHDITEALGKKLGLKIVWEKESGWGTMVSDLQTRKFDALCNADWVSPNVAKEALYTRPYYYQPLFVVAQATDKRFDDSLEALNDAKIRIASMDGDNPRFVAEEDFPKAQIYTLPDMAGESMVLESVGTRKADVTFVDAANFADYDQHNPGKVKLVQLDHPVRIFPVAFVLAGGEDRLRSMLDAALDELIYSGQVDKLLKRYETYPNSFIPVERPHAGTAK